MTYFELISLLKLISKICRKDNLPSLDLYEHILLHFCCFSPDESIAFSDMIQQDMQCGALLDGGHVRRSGPDVQRHRRRDQAIELLPGRLIPLHQQRPELPVQRIEVDMRKHVDGVARVADGFYRQVLVELY